VRVKPHDVFFSREDRYSLGTDLETGRYYASLPVSNGVVDYEEYFELSDIQFAEFLADTAKAVAFADECRRREHDELLMVKPGTNRGTAV
jgi:hypothetical protein